MPVLDYPDWSRVASGSLRFLGKLTVNSSTPVSFQFNAQPSDRSVVLMTDFTGGGFFQGVVTGIVSSARYCVGQWSDQNASTQGTLAIGMISSSVETAYQVTLSRGSGAATVNLYAFASTDSAPAFNVIRPMPFYLAYNGTDLVGQQTSALSVPVVQSTDAFPLGSGPRQPYGSQLVHTPALATKATVTFAATTNRRWVLDYARLTLWSTVGVAAAQATHVLDGATEVWASALSLVAAANSASVDTIGPNAAIVGTAGSALTVEFAAAGPANSAERVTAYAYLLPAGM